VLSAYRNNNAEGNQRSDLMAIWDQYSTAKQGLGTSMGWANFVYWFVMFSGTDVHVFGGIDTGSVNQANDNNTTNFNVALQVL
jgi:hypothetical protein